MIYLQNENARDQVRFTFEGQFVTSGPLSAPFSAASVASRNTKAIFLHSSEKDKVTFCKCSKGNNVQLNYVVDKALWIIY